MKEKFKNMGLSVRDGLLYFGNIPSDFTVRKEGSVPTLWGIYVRVTGPLWCRVSFMYITEHGLRVNGIYTENHGILPSATYENFNGIFYILNSFGYKGKELNVHEHTPKQENIPMIKIMK